MNIFTATGNLGKDPETRFTKDGKPVSSFSLAVTSGYGKNKKTTWVNCSLWGYGEKEHPTVQYLHKGKQVAVSGEISLDEWEDNEGQKRTTLKLNVQNITLLGGQDSPSEASKPDKQPQVAAGGDFDDIPFSNYEYRTLA